MRIIAIVSMLVLLVSFAMADNGQPEYKVKLSILDESGKSTLGSSALSTTENNYGLIHLAYYEGGSFRIQALGTKLKPRTIVPHDENVDYSGELVSLVDFFIMPIVTAPSTVEIYGVITVMLNKNMGGEPEFAVDEHALKATLNDQGEYFFTIPAGENGAPLNAKISVDSESGHGSGVIPRTRRSKVTIKTSYSLYNKDVKKFEAKDCKCTLGMDAGMGNFGDCTNLKVFNIGKSDSLLYLASFDIDEVNVDDANNISFNLEVVHIYAFNPDVVSAHTEEIHSEKTTIVTFKKTITARPGQETIIEIPRDKDSQLPFDAEEKISLTCELK